MEAKTDKESLNELMVKYFVPPLTGQYMQWTQTIMIFIFLIALFVFVLYWYVYVNYSDYQNRISVITNAYLFGKNPQLEFEQYIKNAQENSLDAAVNNIQSNASEVINESSRLNKSANRLAAKVAVDIPQNQAETSNLGISILGNIAKLRDTISKLGGAFVLNNYITDGAISTIKAPSPASSVTPKQSISPSPASSVTPKQSISPSPGPSPSPK